MTSSMLENLNLKKKLANDEYKRIVPGLQARLYDLEKACWDNGVSTVIVLEGWDASGKGTTILALTQRLDPRGFKLYPITAPRTYEQQRPWLWRFWLKVPNRGEMVIFDHSWYGRVLGERVQRVAAKKAVRQAFRDIVEFERMLADDGTVILKFFLHISKKEQRRRFETLTSDPLEAWRVNKEDWARHKKYDRYLEAAEQMFEVTDAEYAPWTIVEATSKSYTRKHIFETTIRALEKRLGRKAPARSDVAADVSRDAELRAAMDNLTPGDA
jgi:AMP-polyphosphate phosphotransferase